jgi:hypothetical protein
MPEDRWNDDEAFEAHITPSREGLARLIRATEELVEPWGGQAAVDSRAVAEIAEEAKYQGQSPWDSTPATGAHGLAQLLITGALDHARALVVLLGQQRAPVYAHIVVARAVLEHAAKAWWLFDPEIDARKRIARGVNERLLSFSLTANLPLPDVEREKARDRLAALVAEAERLGFQKVQSRRGRPPAVVEDRPTQTELVRRLLRDGDDVSLGGLVYAYFSAVAHGTLFGLGQSLTTNAPGIPQVPGVTMAAVYTGSQDLVTVLTAAIIGLGRACERRNEFFAWPDDSWKQTWLDAIYATGRGSRSSDRG